MRQNTETAETERPTCHAVSVLHEQANGRTILRAHGRIEVAPEGERLAHPLPESEPASVASLHEVCRRSVTRSAIAAEAGARRLRGAGTHEPWRAFKFAGATGALFFICNVSTVYNLIPRVSSAFST